jgi:hypothetical protein
VSRSNGVATVNAPSGHRRFLEIYASSAVQIRIRCECGWVSLVMPRDKAEESYDEHLPLGSRR